MNVPSVHLRNFDSNDLLKLPFFFVTITYSAMFLFYFTNIKQRDRGGLRKLSVSLLQLLHTYDRQKVMAIEVSKLIWRNTDNYFCKRVTDTFSFGLSINNLEGKNVESGLQMGKIVVCKESL